MADPAAIWAVEIDASKGTEALEAALASVQGDLEAVDAAAKSTGASISESMAAAASTVKPMKLSTADVAKMFGIDMEDLGAVDAAAKATGKSISESMEAASSRMLAGMSAVGKAVADSVAAKNRMIAGMSAAGQAAAAPAPTMSSFGPASSEAVRRVQQDMLATQKTAEGVGAAIAKALGSSASAAHLEEELARVKLDFDSGRASAEVALRAISAAEQDAIKVMKQHEDQAKKMSLVLAGAYATGTASVFGFVHAGLAGTAEANLMAHSFMLMNREIASIFTPAIHAAITAVQTITQALRSMSGGTQENIRNLIGIAATFLGILTIVPPLIAGIKAVGAALMSAIVANPILAVAAAVAGLLVGTEAGRKALGNLFAAVGPILEAFEPILEIVNDVVKLIAGVLAPALTLVGEILKAVIVPMFELLKPILELLSDVVKGLSGALNSFMGLLGLGNKEEGKKGKQSLTQEGGGREDIEGIMTRIQSGALKNDTAFAQRERMIRHLEGIDRSTRPRFGRDLGVVTP